MGCALIITLCILTTLMYVFMPPTNGNYPNRYRCAAINALLFVPLVVIPWLTGWP